jgi:iron-sulfur cluster assembly protein
MFKVTERAATQILKAAKEGNMTGFALRFAPLRNADGSIEYNKMGFDKIKEGDVHIECAGVDIVFEPAYKDLLQGAVMDFVEIEENHFSFVFFNPNDPHYVPPKEE